ncbi:MAG: hypothetical protein WCT16_03035 [Candidatus Buchananbacteria bacterium]
MIRTRKAPVLGTRKAPVFVFLKDPKKTRKEIKRKGYYELIACFFKQGVHITFLMHSYDENVYLSNIGEAALCGSCDLCPGNKSTHGSMRCLLDKDDDDSCLDIIDAGRQIVKVAKSNSLNGEKQIPTMKKTRCSRPAKLGITQIRLKPMRTENWWDIIQEIKAQSKKIKRRQPKRGE